MKTNKIDTPMENTVNKTQPVNEQEVIKELAKQQRYIKSFGDMINAALWNMDIDDNDEVIAVNWSDEFRHMFGFESTRDFPNTISAWKERIHPDDRKRALDDFYSGIRSRDTENFVYDIEYRVKRKSGEYCWYHAVGRMEYSDECTALSWTLLQPRKQMKKKSRGKLQIKNQEGIEKSSKFLHLSIPPFTISTLQLMI